MPEVSIITPLFNKGPYIAETIQSAQAQSVRDWEMILVENGSTDEGPAIARNFTAGDSRIRLVELDGACGPGAARNRGIDLAAGAWVLFLDADDLLAPDYLEERLAAARAHPKADVIAGHWQEFSDGRANERTTRVPAGWGGDTAALETSAIAFAPWAVHAALVRRDRFDSRCRWQEKLDDAPSEDAAFWFRILFGARVAWAGGAGAFYRTTTPSSRDEIRELSRRFSAVCGVVEHNITFLHDEGRYPTAAQRATLVRIFEREYQRARSAGDAGIAAQALEHAHDWLTRGMMFAPGMLLRRFLGLKRFNDLRHDAA